MKRVTRAQINLFFLSVWSVPPIYALYMARVPYTGNRIQTAKTGIRLHKIQAVLSICRLICSWLRFHIKRYESQIANYNETFRSIDVSRSEVFIKTLSLTGQILIANPKLYSQSVQNIWCSVWQISTFNQRSNSILPYLSQVKKLECAQRTQMPRSEVTGQFPIESHCDLNI